MTLINRKINCFLFLVILLYIAGLTAYTWLAEKIPCEVVHWDQFYFMNENMVKFLIPLLCARLFTVSEVKVLLYCFAALQGFIFVFSIVKFVGYSNIVLYKILTTVCSISVITYLTYYVSSNGFHKK